MRHEQTMVRRFHEKFGATINDEPVALGTRDSRLRLNLILEELLELAEANGLIMEVKGHGFVDISDLRFQSRWIPYHQDGELRYRLADERDVDLIKVADALGDIGYVWLGAGVSYGMDLEPILHEIHRSNMTKLWPGGEVRYRESDGKILKPDSFEEPQLAAVLAEQGTAA